MGTGTRKRRPEGERRTAPTQPGKGSRYTAPINVFETPTVKGEIAAWADALGVATSVLVRECLEEGLRRRRTAWQRTAGGVLDEAHLAAHVARAGGGEK